MLLGLLTSFGVQGDNIYTYGST